MPEILKGLSPEISLALARPHPAPCGLEDQTLYQQLAYELTLNTAGKVKALSPSSLCLPHDQRREVMITGQEVLLGSATDEPDVDPGIDDNLPPPPKDPSQDAWIEKNPGGRGLRHVYYGGWQLWHPISTFQVPSHPYGAAPDRVAILAIKARQLLSDQKTAAWGYRVLGWALHYVQDLAQPFHATLVPDTSMVPWHMLWSWPPKQAIQDTVRESIRSVTNYHVALEGYTLSRLREENSTFGDCLAQPIHHSLLKEDAYREEALKDPKTLALRVAKASVSLSPILGAATYRLFGSALKQRGVDISAEGGVKGGEPDYADLAVRPDLVEQREELRKINCIALANASWGSSALIRWVLSKGDK